jgi:hypothetical protein
VKQQISVYLDLSRKKGNGVRDEGDRAKEWRMIL